MRGRKRSAGHAGSPEPDSTIPDSAAGLRNARGDGGCVSGDVVLLLGDVSSARRLLETLATETSASTAARAGAALAGILATAGDGVAARRTIGKALAREYRDHHVLYSLGAAYAQLGDHARAIESLRVAADTGFPCAIWYATDPLLQPLRGDPQFAAFQDDLAARRDAAAAKHGQPLALRRD